MLAELPKPIDSANITDELDNVGIEFALSAPYVDAYNVTFVDHNSDQLVRSQRVPASPVITNLINETLIVPGTSYIIAVRTVVRSVQSDEAVFEAHLGKRLEPKILVCLLG